LVKIKIPYGRQSINEIDISAVSSTLISDRLTQGPKVKEFEDKVAAYCGAQYAVAVSSGTAALHLACLAAGLEAGGELWTSPNTFVASANCAIYCNAIPDFVDIDPRTYNLSVDVLEAKLSKGKEEGTLPKIIIPVHFAGQSCEMERIQCLSEKYNFTVIEDASHAIGGKYKGSKIGSCKYSDMTVFSFHPVKIMTTGEGGMVLTNRKNLYEKLILLRSHGITRNPDDMEGEYHGPWYYQQVELGFNYRITDIQAALGLSQLKRLDEFVERRNYLAARYDEKLKDLPLTLPWQHPDVYSSVHLYVIRIKRQALSKNRFQVFKELIKAGIGVNVHYIPVHIQPYYKKLGFKEGDFPEAEHYYQEAISLPIFYELIEKDQNYVVRTLQKALS
jgi:UDP-4-amino-4,6-dideoxy-N-acetyl-beta-L-altrosamine transaminase